jgi:hypothetical protein
MLTILHVIQLADRGMAGIGRQSRQIVSICSGISLHFSAEWWNIDILGRTMMSVSLNIKDPEAHRLETV